MIANPRNHFELVGAEAYLFIAGIGITPILPMMRQANARRLPWRIVYGGRSLSTMAFVDELQQLTGSTGAIELVPQDIAGFPDLDRVIRALPPGGKVYACGPEPMLVAIETACDRHAPAGTLHLERFGPGAAPPVTAAINTAFEVELAQAGGVYIVPPDRSVLDVLREVHPDVMYACNEGYSGTCQTKVLAGIPDHRDELLSDAEKAAGDTMLLCISRSCSPRLVLDI